MSIHCSIQKAVNISSSPQKLTGNTKLFFEVSPTKIQLWYCTQVTVFIPPLFKKVILIVPVAFHRQFLNTIYQLHCGSDQTAQVSTEKVLSLKTLQALSSLDLRGFLGSLPPLPALSEPFLEALSFFHFTSVEAQQNFLAFSWGFSLTFLNLYLINSLHTYISA